MESYFLQPLVVPRERLPVPAALSRNLDRPDGMPVVATTATANDRVVDDVTDQLPGLEMMRGDLVRESLRIQAVELDSRAERLAWLAETLDIIPVSGIVYCLTTSNAEDVAGWLAEHGHDVLPYHGGMAGDIREARETKLMHDEIDALVATNALGMGFNKPDLGWVIHFQRPPNLIRYYQEIGRAGRALDEAYAVVLSDPEADDIAEYFIDQAFPSPDAFEDVLGAVEASEEPLYKYEILKQVDISWGVATSCLNILEVEGAIRKGDDGFVRTETEWTYDYNRVETVTRQQRAELARIQEFVSTDDCLTKFIDDELDGQLTEPCGRCANCAGSFLPTDVTEETLVDEARGYYRSDGWKEIPPRKYIHKQQGGRVKIPEAEQLEPGRALSVYNDPGWGSVVHQGRTDTGRYSDDLVDAAAAFVDEWAPTPSPTWVTAVPSTHHEGLVVDVAERIADEPDLPFVDAVACTGTPVPQAELESSYQRCWNVTDAFETMGDVRDAPVLLVDDIVGSRWTLTEVGTTLRRAGSGPVHPFTLAERRSW